MHAYTVGMYRTSEAADEVVGARLLGGGVDVFLRELPLLQPVRYVLVDAGAYRMLSKQHGSVRGGVSKIIHTDTHTDFLGGRQAAHNSTKHEHRTIDAIYYRSILYPHVQTARPDARQDRGGWEKTKRRKQSNEV